MRCGQAVIKNVKPNKKYSKKINLSFNIKKTPESEF